MKAFTAFCRKQLRYVEELEATWLLLWTPPIDEPQYIVERIRDRAAALGLVDLVAQAPKDAGLDAARLYVAAGLAACQTTAGDVLTVKQVVELLQVSRDKVLNWINTGKLPAANTGNGRLPRYRVKASDLDTFLSRHTKTTTPPVKRRRLPAAETRYYPES